MSSMPRAILAGAVYWGIVFTWAFFLGVLRSAVIAPRFGEVAAVVVEVPFVLWASWFSSRWIMLRLGVGSTVLERLVMGGAAFALLMGAELALSVFMAGRPAADWLASFATLPGAIGLAGQVAFGIVPLAQRATHRP